MLTFSFVKFLRESDAEYAANFLKRYAMEDGTLLTVSIYSFKLCF